MLINDLCTIEQILRDGDNHKLSVLIQVNPFLDLFKGHFPGNPILPGVCIILIIKDILKDQLDKTLVLENIISIKYLTFINPEVNGKIKIDLEINELKNDSISCNAIVSFESAVFCRFKGAFKRQQ
jgi:3-hydroxyacyl-[acyl-carrier-protein] dehydratase